VKHSTTPTSRYLYLNILSSTKSFEARCLELASVKSFEARCLVLDTFIQYIHDLEGGRSMIGNTHALSQTFLLFARIRDVA